MSADRRSLCLLLAGDSAHERAEIRRRLRDYPFSVVEADSVAEAITSARPPCTPDCVLLHHRLRDGDSLDVLAGLKNEHGLIMCAVVVVSGVDDVESSRAALDAGAQALMLKEQLEPELLARMIEHAVERHRLRLELGERDSLLSQSKERLTLALEAAETGIWTWEPSTDAVSWTPECYAILGVSEREFDGTGASFFRRVYPDDLPGVTAAVESALQRHAPFRHEFRIVRPDGSLHWVLNVGRARYDQEGRPVQMLGTITSVDQRRREQDALRERERQLDLLTSTMPNLIALFDRQLRHVFVNAAVGQATGLPTSSLLGKTNREIGMPTALCDEWDAALRVVFETGERRSIVFDFEVGGETRSYENRLIPELTAEGVVHRVLVVGSDVTDLKRAVTARDRVLSLVSHDLKNPLNTLTLGIEAIRGRLSEAPESVRGRFDTTLARMARQVKKMDGQIEELLDAARMQRQQSLELDATMVDLVELTRIVIAEHTATARNQRIEFCSSVDVLVGAWDARRIERVLGNLLSNALKYSPPPTAIEVSLERVQDDTGCWAVTTVRDRGIGIPTSELGVVFEWYRRASNAERSPVPGTGIGLAGAHEIVKQHGGTMAVESSEGVGSVFSFRLPLRSDD